MTPDLPLWRMARRSDHTSSHEAARMAVASGLVGTHEARILDFLRTNGGAFSLRVIASGAGLDDVQVARRLSTMVRRGDVRRIAVAGERLRWMATR